MSIFVGRREHKDLLTRSLLAAQQILENIFRLIKTVFFSLSPAPDEGASRNAKSKDVITSKSISACNKEVDSQFLF